MVLDHMPKSLTFIALDFLSACGKKEAIIRCRRDECFWFICSIVLGLELDLFANNLYTGVKIRRDFPIHKSTTYRFKLRGKVHKKLNFV